MERQDIVHILEQNGGLICNGPRSVAVRGRISQVDLRPGGGRRSSWVRKRGVICTRRPPNRPVEDTLLEHHSVPGQESAIELKWCYTIGVLASQQSARQGAGRRVGIREPTRQGRCRGGTSVERGGELRRREVDRGVHFHIVPGQYRRRSALGGAKVRLDVAWKTPLGTQGIGKGSRVLTGMNATD